MTIQIFTFSCTYHANKVPTNKPNLIPPLEHNCSVNQNTHLFPPPRPLHSPINNPNNPNNQQPQNPTSTPQSLLLPSFANFNISSLLSFNTGGLERTVKSSYPLILTGFPAMTNRPSIDFNAMLRACTCGDAYTLEGELIGAQCVCVCV